MQPFSGIILLDKPLGITSFIATKRVRACFGGVKGGHTGSLDPLASGLLLVCLGRATKQAHAMLHANKRYHVVIRLGVTTDSGDAEGTVVRVCDAMTITRGAVDAILPSFRGAIQQRPPYYSAIKHKGEPLYRLARRGIRPERPVRDVMINALDVLYYTPPYLCLSVACSKGTYIRSLGEDIGNALGVGAFIVALRRVAIEDYRIQDAITLTELQQDVRTERLLNNTSGLSH